jgi:hypothetical protein
VTPKTAKCRTEKGVPNITSAAVKQQNLAAMPHVTQWWIRVMNDENESMQFRLEASKCIADRALGRPAQAVEMSGGDGTIAMMVFTGVPLGAGGGGHSFSGR